MSYLSLIQGLFILLPIMVSLIIFICLFAFSPPLYIQRLELKSNWKGQFLVSMDVLLKGRKVHPLLVVLVVGGPWLIPLLSVWFKPRWFIAGELVFLVLCICLLHHLARNGLGLFSALKKTIWGRGKAQTSALDNEASIISTVDGFMKMSRVFPLLASLLFWGSVVTLYIAEKSIIATLPCMIAMAFPTVWGFRLLWNFERYMKKLRQFGLLPECIHGC